MKKCIHLIRKLLLNFKMKDDKVIKKKREMESLSKDVVRYHFIQTDQAAIITCKSSTSSNTSGQYICIYPLYFPLPK